MTKHGESGLGLVIVKAVNDGDIVEPITFEKVKKYCENNNINATKNYMRSILSNATKNNHSPTYKVYFKRNSKGQYFILDIFRKSKKYYWLNINSDHYEWAFSDLKVGRRQEYSNLNEKGGKRKNQSCFIEIKVGDFVLAYETGIIQGITTICEVVDKYCESNEIVVVFEKRKDYNEFLTLKQMKKLETLNDCKIINLHRGTLFNIDKEHFDIIVQKIEKLNEKINYNVELDKQVERAKNISSEERKKRLDEKKDFLPEKIEISTFGFKRNPDVIAEVLERANGTCEKCKKKAPFIRKSDNTPYLEVHHKVRLADGGEDTVKNAIAVCPNCHRELHFG